MAGITAKIESAQLEALNKMNDMRQEMIDDTEGARACLANYEAALKAWAKIDRKSWKNKSLELNFGMIGFRLPPLPIKLKLAVENIIERLRAKKMHTRAA